MRWIVLLVILTALAGCGRPEPVFAPVRGRVYYRGQPLAGGTIVFTPDRQRGAYGPLAYGHIDGSGGYTLETDGKVGAVVGWHVVTVANGRQLPPRYGDPERSGQCVDVRAGEGVYDLKLE